MHEIFGDTLALAYLSLFSKLPLELRAIVRRLLCGALNMLSLGANLSPSRFWVSVFCLFFIRGRLLKVVMKNSLCYAFGLRLGVYLSSTS